VVGGPASRCWKRRAAPARRAACTLRRVGAAPRGGANTAPSSGEDPKLGAGRLVAADLSTGPEAVSRATRLRWWDGLASWRATGGARAAATRSRVSGMSGRLGFRGPSATAQAYGAESSSRNRRKGAPARQARPGRRARPDPGRGRRRGIRAGDKAPRSTSISAAHGEAQVNSVCR